MGFAVDVSKKAGWTVEMAFVALSMATNVFRGFTDVSAGKICITSSSRLSLEYDAGI